MTRIKHSLPGQIGQFEQTCAFCKTQDYPFTKSKVTIVADPCAIVCKELGSNIASHFYLKNGKCYLYKQINQNIVNTLVESYCITPT